MEGLRDPKEPQFVDGPSMGLELVFPGVFDLRFVLSTFSPPLPPSPETVILGAPSFSASLAPLVSACSQVFNPYHMLQLLGIYCLNGTGSPPFHSQMGLIAYCLVSRPPFLPARTLLFLTALSDSFLELDFYLLSTSGVHLSTFLPADPILTPPFQRCPQPCSPLLQHSFLKLPQPQMGLCSLLPDMTNLQSP